MIFNKSILGIVISVLFCAAAQGYETKLLSEIPIKGKVSAIAVNTAMDTAASVSESTKYLDIIDTVSSAVIHEVPLPEVPTGVVIHKGSNRVLVSTLTGSLLLYDLKTGELASTLTMNSAVYSVAVDEVNNKVFLGMDDGIKIVDLSIGNAVSSIAVPGRSLKLTLGQSKLAVVSKNDSGSKLRLIDPVTGSVTAETSLSGEVMSIGLDELLGYILVTLADKAGISLYDTTSLKLLEGIPTAKQLQLIAINPSTHLAVLADTLDGSLSIADLTLKAVDDTVPLYGQMGPLSVDTSRNRVLAAHNQNLMVIQLENPVPRITGLVPQEMGAGNDGFPLTVMGEKFVKDSQTRFAGTLFNSLFESNELLMTTIPAEKLLTPGDVLVSVINPPPGGGVSNELTFKVLTPAPQLSAISPALVVVGSPITFRIYGKGFLPSADVNLNGKKIPAYFISSTVLEVTVDAALVATKGTYPVSVTNNGATSFTSNALSIAVVSAEDASQAGKTASAQSIESQGTGSLGGRILNTEMQPLKGVTVKFRNTSVRTDEYGNFTLDNLPAGKRTILVDGSSADEIGAHYPTIPLSVDITAGLRNVMPFTPYLHRQKHYNFANIDPATDTILTDPEVPGFELRIPRGVNIIGWDGKANARVSVRKVPIDRLPVKPLPKNANARTVYMFYFDKVGGGRPDRPIPVKAPNDLGLLPGEKAVLWYYDESPTEGEAPNDWAIAGTGTVTSDGRFIMSDPGVGIPKFCCGASTYGGSGGGSPKSGPFDGDCGSPKNNAGDPVNLATGYFIHEKTDYKLNGIIPLDVKRYYRSGDAYNGPFGGGTYFGFDWFLEGQNTDMLLLTKPGNYRYQFSKRPDGTYANTTDPEYLGDVFVRNGDGSYTLQKKDGWRWKFAGDSLLDQITDPNGNALTFLKQYDGNITSIIMPDGTRVDFAYSFAGIFSRDRLNTITGPLGTVTYNYGSCDQLSSVQYPDGSSIVYGYDDSCRMNSITENGKPVVTNLYYDDSRVHTQTHPDGGVYTFHYTIAGGNLTETSMTAPNSAATTWRFYDDFGSYHDGYIVKKTTPDGTTTYDREAGTNLIKSITDPLGRNTSFSYDAKGRRLSMKDPVGNTTSFEYEDACSNVTKVTDALSKITNVAYTFAPGTCRKTRTEIRDPLQHLTVVEYDNYGMPTTITDPNNTAFTFAYDPAHAGQLTSIADLLGNTKRIGYDALWRITSIIDPKGAKTTYGYDNVTERVASVTDTFGNITRYTYDLGGNLLMVNNAKDGAIFYEYDDRNRITKMTDQLGRYETYSYYRNAEITTTTGDNLKSYTDRKRQTTTFNQFDLMNRLKQVTFGDGSYLQYTYDAAGRATNFYDSISNSAVNYTYNDYGCGTCSGKGVDRISRETTTLATIDYTYYADGRRASMTVAGEPVVNYTYDDAGRLNTLSRVVGSGTRIYKLGYDDGDRRASLQLPLANGVDYVTTVYGYDIANRLTSLLLQGAATTIENLTYAYDPNGNRTNFTRSVTQTLSPTVSNTRYDVANQMLSFNGKTLVYDDNGNLQTKIDVCGTTTYSWDARNRLTGISSYKPDCTALTASFGYDALNRRISKNINGTTTQFVYDRWDIIQEINGGVKTNYVRSLYIDEPLTRIAGSTIRHYVKDALGSVMALTDDLGTTKTTYIYDAFGNVTTTGEPSDNPFQFTSRENDGTGLLHYRFRYYSPEMQRFISEDPIRLRGGINYYTMTGNNPINRVDPLGLEWRNGSYHYTDDELQTLQEEVGRVGHSMAEVAELDHKLIEEPLILNPLLKLIDLGKRLFTPKPKNTCPPSKPSELTPFEKYYFGL